MNKWLVGTAGVLVLLLFLLVSMPARFALQFVTLPPGVQIGGVDGSVWRGEIGALRVEDIMFRDVTWQLRPLALITGSVAADIRIGDHVDNIVIGTGNLRLSRQNLNIHNLQLEGRVVDFAAFAPQPSPFPMRGDLVLQVHDYTWGQPVCSALSGELELVGGAIQVGQNWESLGALRADLSCEEGWLRAELDDNDLGLNAFMRASTQYAEGQFQITPSTQAPRTIRNLVAMLPESGRQPQRFNVRF